MLLIYVLLGLVIVLLVSAIIGVSSGIATMGTFIVDYFWIVIIVYAFIFLFWYRKKKNESGLVLGTFFMCTPLLECIYIISYLGSLMKNTFLDMISLIVFCVIIIMLYLFIYAITLNTLWELDEKPSGWALVIQIVFVTIRIGCIAFISIVF